MACKRSPVRSRYSPPKSTVLRRKYGAFLFAEADFWGLHCFACTVFRLLQAVPIQPPTFDFTPFSKKNVCRPAFQQSAASSPSMYGVRSKLKVILSWFDDGNFEMRTRNRHHLQTKRPPSKIALDERSGIVFGCARRLGTECRALRSQAGAAKG